MIDVQPKTTFVGVGSSHGDDQVGWMVIQKLQEGSSGDSFDFRKAKSPADILDWIQDCERLVICDACHGLGTVSWCRFGLSRMPVTPFLEIARSARNQPVR